MSTDADRTVTVAVCHLRGAFHARAGRGARATVATDVRSEKSAVQRAAAKYFRLDESNVQTSADIVVEYELMHAKGSRYRATLPERRVPPVRFIHA